MALAELCFDTLMEECHHMYHGEKVAFGTLAQLVMENIPHEELEEIIMWCIEVGLPVTLEELGAGNVTDAYGRYYRDGV